MRPMLELKTRTRFCPFKMFVDDECYGFYHNFFLLCSCILSQACTHVPNSSAIIGATTHSITTFISTTFSKMKLSIMTLSITTISIMTFSITIKMWQSSIMTLSIMAMHCYAECHLFSTLYAKCRYSECRYSECSVS